MKDKLIEIAMGRKRSMILIMVGIVIFGVVARLSIPTESEPRVEIPYFVITVVHEGISPEDATRLLIRPIELELKALDNVKEITGTGAEHMAFISVEFDASMDIDVAMADVREAVDRAKPELPITAEEPVVTETASTDFPIVQINLVSEKASERLVLDTARALRDRIETIPGIRSVVIQGHRDEVLEITVEPARLLANGITVEQLIVALTRNNQLIPAGSLDSGKGSIALKIPSVVEEAGDLVDLPLFTDGETVVTLGDVATVRRTFKDRTHYVRANGKQSVSLFPYRQVGANSIDTTRAIREVIDDLQPTMPENIELFITRDASAFDMQQVTELEGNIVTALFLVLAVVLPSIGLRSSVIVAFSIPVSFLFALVFLWLFGHSFNFMVMFGMLMALGMLIDGAIIVTEDAERRMEAGASGERGYSEAARRMFAPVTASTATTLAAFLPLLFWPGVPGEYMRYLPLTVLAVLIGSLVYTLIFVPSLGATLSKHIVEREVKSRTASPWDRDVNQLTGFSQWYAKLISSAARHTFFTLVATVLVVYGIFSLYNVRDLGVIFFNENDPVYSQAFVRARGNLNIEEAHALVREVERAIVETDGVKELSTFISSGFERGEGQRQTYRGGSAADVIGTIWVELHEANQRTRNGIEIGDEIRAKAADIGGIIVDLKPFEGQLLAGKPIFIQFSAREREKLAPIVETVREYLVNDVNGLRNLEDTLPLPGFEWQLDVDRAKAALFGVDVTTVGLAAQLITDGAKLGEYRPNDADEALDIRLRFSASSRSIDQLDELQIATNEGLVPISNFVTRRAVKRQDAIQRRDQRDIHVIQADVVPGVLADAKISEIQAWLDEQSFDSSVDIRFRGTAEDQAESIDFVAKAFSFALLLMFVLLVTQYNSIYQSFVTIFAIVLSTAGVFLGLVITNSPFSAILSGVGIIALAGIVVNNSIVLIDTFNQGRKEHPEFDLVRLVTLTGLQRLRPVILTTVTTMIGLLPLASHQSIDFINRTWTSGGNLSTYWVPLAQAIAFGLSFATILTLVVTPALLILPVAAVDTASKWLVRLRRILPWGNPSRSEIFPD